MVIEESVGSPDGQGEGEGRASSRLRLALRKKFADGGPKGFGGDACLRHAKGEGDGDGRVMVVSTEAEDSRLICEVCDLSCSRSLSLEEVEVEDPRFLNLARSAKLTKEAELSEEAEMLEPPEDARDRKGKEPEDGRRKSKAWTRAREAGSRMMSLTSFPLMRWYVRLAGSIWSSLTMLT